MEVFKEIGTFHLHTKFSDGKDDLFDVIKYAVLMGIKRVGITDHAPIMVDKSWAMKKDQIELYINAIEKIKEKFKNKIEIYKGMEIDYIEGYKENMNLKQKYNLDYIIGSVHGFKFDNDFYTIDGKIENFNVLINKKFKKNFKYMVENYFNAINKMVEKLKPDVIGHLDLIKLRNNGNRSFNEREKWYKNLVLKTLENIKKHNLIVEINTGGYFRHKVDSFYPSKWIIENIYKLNIRIMLNSDSHWKEMIIGSYKNAFKLIKEIGFTEIWIIKDGIFQPYKIE